MTVQYRLAARQPAGDDRVPRSRRKAHSEILIDRHGRRRPAGGGGGRGGFGAAARVTNRAGLNRYTWNLQYPDASTFQGMILWQGSTAGPFAAPGTYTVRVTVGSDAPITEKFVVREGSADEGDERRSRRAVALRACRFAIGVTAANDAVKTIRNVQAPARGSRGDDERQRELRRDGEVVRGSAQRTSRTRSTRRRTRAARIRSTSRSGSTIRWPRCSASSTAGERRPPKQSYDVYAVLEPKLQAELSALQAGDGHNLDEDQRRAEGGGPAGDRAEHRLSRRRRKARSARTTSRTRSSARADNRASCEQRSGCAYRIPSSSMSNDQSGLGLTARTTHAEPGRRHDAESCAAAVDVLKPDAGHQSRERVHVQRTPFVLPPFEMTDTSSDPFAIEEHSGVRLAASRSWRPSLDR